MAPSLQVLRLLEPASAPAAAAATAAPKRAAAAPAAAQAPAAGPPAKAPAVMEMVAHIQERGDVGAMLGDWLGEKGSGRWIEGFGIAPTSLLAAKDIEYQAVLGKGWLSPWVEGGQFCGSRGMALPILGLRLRLRGEASETYDVFYAATFTDGSTVGPVAAGEACEADSLAPIEAFQVLVRPKGAKPASSATASKPAAKPVAKETPKPKPPAGKAKPAVASKKR